MHFISVNIIVPSLEDDRVPREDGAPLSLLLKTSNLNFYYDVSIVQHVKKRVLKQFFLTLSAWCVTDKPLDNGKDRMRIIQRKKKKKKTLIFQKVMNYVLYLFCKMFALQKKKKNVNK